MQYLMNKQRDNVIKNGEGDWNISIIKSGVNFSEGSLICLSVFNVCEEINY